MFDRERIEEAKSRLADRFTSAELCDLLDIPVEDIIEEYWHLILRKSEHFTLELAEIENDDDDLS